jgi:peptidyl-prolyl cis-trans isomerase A (cyclophilin A)
MRPIEQLDKKYSVFGYVVKGLGVVEMIELNDKIISISIDRKGETANKFDAIAVFSEKNRKKL